MSLATEARQFLRSTRSGMLSTHSSKMPGYPYGSVAPFVLDHQARPVILISTIAEHTQNIIADPRLSLLVIAESSGGQDLQAGARLTLVGEAKRIDKEDADLKARYLRYIPQAVGYFAMHDFSFYRIQVLRARYIAGFGKMSWMTGEELGGEEISGKELVSEDLNSGVPQTTPNKLESQEAGIVEHMNADHRDSLVAYCAHFHHATAEDAEMLGIDSDGFDVKATMPGNDIRILRFNFDQPVFDAMSARTALVAMSKATRA